MTEKLSYPISVEINDRGPMTFDPFPKAEILREYIVVVVCFVECTPKC